MANKSNLFFGYIDKFKKQKRVMVVSTVAGVLFLAGLGVLAYESWTDYRKSNGSVTKAVAESDDAVEHLAEADTGKVCEIVSLTYQNEVDIGESVEDSLGTFVLGTVSETEGEVCLEYQLKTSADVAYGDLPIISVCDAEGYSGIGQSYFVTDAGESDDDTQTIKSGKTQTVRCRMDISEYGAYELRMLLDDKTVYLAGAK